MIDVGVLESGSASKPMSTCESHGDRLRFTVELRPGETTIVSWKKLLKEAATSKNNKHGPKAAGPSSTADQLPAPQPNPPPLPPALASSEHPAENEGKDAQGQAGTNRLSTVIEKIERMYAVCFCWIDEFRLFPLVGGEEVSLYCMPFKELAT